MKKKIYYLLNAKSDPIRKAESALEILRANPNQMKISEILKKVVTSSTDGINEIRELEQIMAKISGKIPEI